MWLQVLATLRAELFRSLLLQKIEFFDVHTASNLTNLISTELDSVRSFVFRNVSRDRGPRAVLEVSPALLMSIETALMVSETCSWNGYFLPLDRDFEDSGRTTASDI